jgi:hypothetical protein
MKSSQCGTPASHPAFDDSRIDADTVPVSPMGMPRQGFTPRLTSTIACDNKEPKPKMAANAMWAERKMDGKVTPDRKMIAPKRHKGDAGAWGGSLG